MTRTLSIPLRRVAQASREPRACCHATLDGYEQKGRMILAGLDDVKLSKLTPARIDGFYDECLRKGTSASTVHHYHRVLSAALRQAER